MKHIGNSYIKAVNFQQTQQTTTIINPIEESMAQLPEEIKLKILSYLNFRLINRAVNKLIIDEKNPFHPLKSLRLNPIIIRDKDKFDQFSDYLNSSSCIINKLDLRDTPVSENNFLQLSLMLKGNISITELKLSVDATMINNEENFFKFIKYLTKRHLSLGQCRLISLDLSNVPLTSKKLAQLLSAFIVNNTVFELNLSGCNLKADSLKQLGITFGMKEMYNKITSLNISNNDFSQIKSTYLNKVMNNFAHLAYLNISNTKISEENKLLLIKHLKNTKVMWD
ncbi:MAG: hypothetical protein ACK4M7_02175 [Burkholderiales bacterium]